MDPACAVQIILDRGNKPYFTEGKVTGRVVVNTPGIWTSRMAVVCTGRAEVQAHLERTCWASLILLQSCATERENIVTNEEDLLFVRMSIVGDGFELGNLQELRPWPHEYPFEFQLPRGLPPSYSGDRASVNYDLHVELGNDPTPISVHPFTVRTSLSPGDNVVDLDDPIFFLERLPGKSISLTIPKRGYVPGEVIPLMIFFGDGINRLDFDYMELSLIQDMVFYICPARRKHSVVQAYSMVTKSEIDTEAVVGYRGSLTVPITVQPLTMGTCSIIKVRYRISARLIVKTLRFSSTESVVAEHFVPIVLGDPSSNMTTAVAEVTDDDPLVLDEPPSYGDFAAPSYKEATRLQSQMIGATPEEFQNTDTESSL